MSRITKPPPYGHHLVHLADAYQLCARCGEILSVGETVQVVYRGDRGTGRGYIHPSGPDWWGIYTHAEGPDCPPRAVSGWQAVRRAIEMRGPDNPTMAETEALGKRKGREAQPVILWGFVFPFVSLLDSEHCDVEKRAVTVAPREILKSDLSPVQSRIDGIELDKEDDVREYRHNVKKARVRYDYIEDAYIRALDDEEMRCTRHARDKFEAELTRAIFCMPISKHLDTRMLLARTLVCALVRGRSRCRHAHTVLGERAELIREVTVRERANLYVKACAVRKTMDCVFELFYPPGGMTKKRSDYEMSVPEESKKATLKGVTHGEILSWDTVERPVEYALYSKLPVTFGNQGDKKFTLPVTFFKCGDKEFWRFLQGKTLDEFHFYLLSGPKPEPFVFVFDSRRFPEQFEWEDAPSDLVEHWPRNPPSPSFGRLARLKQSVLRQP
jgi:hypothetical protein